MSEIQFSQGQQKAMDVLKSGSNVFLTGSAGTGKSFVIREYEKSIDSKLPVLASTGAAAVLIGGRTFHSFFGLGIMRGGLAPTVEKAIKNPRITKRIATADVIVIDEISMIPPDAFMAANLIAQQIRCNRMPFGGLRVIAVGDFLQLPPVNPHKQQMDWLFETPLWEQMGFEVAELTESMRAEDKFFVDLLNEIRIGNVTEDVRAFLEDHVSPLEESFDGTVLFPRRAQAEAYNLSQLRQLESEAIEIPTQVIKKKGMKVQKTTEQLLALAPVPECLILKKGALVMIRKNDADLKYVNGSLAWVERITKETLILNLLAGGEVELKKEDFDILNGDGESLASIRNFPVTLAWATTIHKSQGSSIDRVHININQLWECGQAYVALSRVRSPEGLHIDAWDEASIKADQRAVDFLSR